MTQQANTTPLTGLQPGDKLDKYEVREPIGAGGMAVVYKGYDALLDRFVAIKQINTDLAADNGDEGVVERFRREAKLQKRIAPQHKHLVSFIDFIEEPRGLFIVQEYVDGVSLEQILTTKPNPMDHRQALGIIGATTVALQAIHAKGIVHRDLKPSNILLPHEGGLKVCDFGLAASIAEQDTLPLGSVRYMAPELFRGDNVDGRADIYALGMIAYEMLLGRAAFNEAFKIVLRDQRNQALRWMKWHTNARVRATPLNQLNHNIADTLSELVSRMMEKDPQARIASADELLETIRRHFTPGASPDKRIVDDTEAVARQSPMVSPAAATAKLPTGSKLPYVLVALLVVNVMAGLGLWAWYAQNKAAKYEARREQTRQVINEAKQLYKSGDFGAAMTLFDKVNQAWPNDPDFGKVSKAGALLCQVHTDMAAGRYLDAVTKIDQIDQLGVSGIDRNMLAELRTRSLDSDAFAREVAKIEGLISEGQFSLARAALQQQLNREQTEDKIRVLEDLKQRIGQSTRDADIADIQRRVQLQLDSNRRDEAMGLLAEGARKYPGSPLEQWLTRLRGEAEYEQSIGEAVAAEARGEYSQAIEAYQRAINKRADDPESDAKCESRIRYLKTQLAMERARERFAAGDMATAEVALREALAHDPENEEAKGLLGRIATADEQASTVRAGDEAMASRQFETAIIHYSKALEFGADPRVAEKLVNARLQLHLEKGRVLMAQKQFAQAAEAIAVAEGLAPDDPVVQKARNELQGWSNYQKHIDEGDQLHSRGQHGAAIDKYTDAKKVIKEGALPQSALDEVQARINAVEYDNLFTKAKFYVEGRQWGPARANLNILMNMPNGNTPEVQALMAEVNRSDPQGAVPRP